VAISRLIRDGIKLIIPSFRTAESIAEGVSGEVLADEILFLKRYAAARKDKAQRERLYDLAFGKEVRAMLALYFQRFEESGRWNFTSDQKVHHYEQVRADFATLFDKDVEALRAVGGGSAAWIAKWRNDLSRTLSKNRNSLKWIATALADKCISRRLGR
jgi:hypothetical protein